jgi:hypothetical protein
VEKNPCIFRLSEGDVRDITVGKKVRFPDISDFTCSSIELMPPNHDWRESSRKALEKRMDDHHNYFTNIGKKKR